MRDDELAPGAGWAKPVQVGALVAAVIVSVILLGLVSSHGKRLAAVERGVKTNRNEVGRLGDRPEPVTEAEVAELGRSLGRLRTSTERLDRKVAALALEGRDEGLAESIGELTKIVRELSDELAEVRRIAEKPGETPGRVAAQADVPAKDVAALSNRVAKLERAAAELEKLAGSTSRGSSENVRINEQALRALVENLIDGEVKEALEEMRRRFMGPRRPR